MLAETSIGTPFSVARKSPIVSKFSRLSPIGSLCVWQEAQAGLVAWALSRSRTVFSAPEVSFTIEKSTLGGGGGVGLQSRMSIRATPRSVGEDRPGWENIAS